MVYSRRKLLTDALTTVALAPIAGACQTVGPALQGASETVAQFSSKAYEELVGRFVERSHTRYIGNKDGAVVTFYTPEGAEMKVIDGSPEGVSIGQKSWRGIQSLFGVNIPEYDGKTPDQVIITNNGLATRYDHTTGVNFLPAAATGLERATEEVRKYMQQFAVAGKTGHVAYEDAMKYGDSSISATLERTVITARAQPGLIRTDYFRVINDGRLTVEITGTPGLFSKLMANLVLEARTRIGQEQAEGITSQL